MGERETALEERSASLDTRELRLQVREDELDRAYEKLAYNLHKSANERSNLLHKVRMTIVLCYQVTSNFIDLPQVDYYNECPIIHASLGLLYCCL